MAARLHMLHNPFRPYLTSGAAVLSVAALVATPLAAPVAAVTKPVGEGNIPVQNLSAAQTWSPQAQTKYPAATLYPWTVEPGRWLGPLTAGQPQERGSARRAGRVTVSTPTPVQMLQSAAAAPSVLAASTDDGAVLTRAITDTIALLAQNIVINAPINLANLAAAIVTQPQNLPGLLSFVAHCFLLPEPYADFGGDYTPVYRLTAPLVGALAKILPSPLGAGADPNTEPGVILTVWRGFRDGLNQVLASLPTPVIPPPVFGSIPTPVVPIVDPFVAASRVDATAASPATAQHDAVVVAPLAKVATTGSVSGAPVAPVRVSARSDAEVAQTPTVSVLAAPSEAVAAANGEARSGVSSAEGAVPAPASPTDLMVKPGRRKAAGAAAESGGAQKAESEDTPGHQRRSSTPHQPPSAAGSHTVTHDSAAPHDGDTSRAASEPSEDHRQG
jgi:hypothetical protein